MALWVDASLASTRDGLMTSSRRRAALQAEFASLQAEAQRLRASVDQLYLMWQPLTVHAALTRGVTSMLPLPAAP